MVTTSTGVTQSTDYYKPRQRLIGCGLVRPHTRRAREQRAYLMACSAGGLVIHAAVTTTCSNVDPAGPEVRL